MLSRRGQGREMLGLFEGAGVVSAVVGVVNLNYRPCSSGEPALRTGQSSLSCGGFDGTPSLIAGLTTKTLVAVVYWQISRSEPRGNGSALFARRGRSREVPAAAPTFQVSSVVRLAWSARRPVSARRRSAAPLVRGPQNRLTAPRIGGRPPERAAQRQSGRVSAALLGHLSWVDSNARPRGGSRTSNLPNCELSYPTQV
jgi:hypothetical protein